MTAVGKLGLGVGEDLGKANEGDVGKDSIKVADGGVGDGKDVGLFAEIKARIKTQGGFHLIGALFDSDDFLGAVREGILGETTGRRADIKDSLVMKIVRKSLRRPRKLILGPRNEFIYDAHDTYMSPYQHSQHPQPL